MNITGQLLLWWPVRCCFSTLLMAFHGPANSWQKSSLELLKWTLKKVQDMKHLFFAFCTSWTLLQFCDRLWRRHSDSAFCFLFSHGVIPSLYWMLSLGFLFSFPCSVILSSKKHMYNYCFHFFLSFIVCRYSCEEKINGHIKAFSSVTLMLTCNICIMFFCDRVALTKVHCCMANVCWTLGCVLFV